MIVYLDREGCAAAPSMACDQSPVKYLRLRNVLDRIASALLPWLQVLRRALQVAIP
jgi:hypothetical protein